LVVHAEPTAGGVDYERRLLTREQILEIVRVRAHDYPIAFATWGGRCRRKPASHHEVSKTYDGRRNLGLGQKNRRTH
jgi:hypothetical protein